MFRVRYPTGLVVQYNTARFLKHSDTVWSLYDQENGTWIASIQPSSGAIVESVPPCAVYSEGTSDRGAVEAVAHRLEARDATLPYALLRRMKRALARYNSKTGAWR